ncbi:DUF6188 family protein, partial [Gordonia aichiensis]
GEAGWQTGVECRNSFPEESRWNLSRAERLAMIELQIQGTVVKEILVGYTITLRSGTSASEYELQIECELSLSDPAGFTKVAPEEYSLIESRLGSLVGATVISACSDDNGELIMKFSIRRSSARPCPA